MSSSWSKTDLIYLAGSLVNAPNHSNQNITEIHESIVKKGMLLYKSLIKAFFINFRHTKKEARPKMTPLYEYYIDGVTLTTISVFGIFGTLLSLRVLLHPQLRNSFSSLLSGLAVSDTLFLVFVILIIGLPKISDWWVKISFILICDEKYLTTSFRALSSFSATPCIVRFRPSAYRINKCSLCAMLLSFISKC